MRGNTRPRRVRACVLIRATAPCHTSAGRWCGEGGRTRSSRGISPDAPITSVSFLQLEVDPKLRPSLRYHLCVIYLAETWPLENKLLPLSQWRCGVAMRIESDAPRSDVGS